MEAGERDSPHLTVLIFADDESKFGYGECKSFAIDFLVSMDEHATCYGMSISYDMSLIWHEHRL